MVLEGFLKEETFDLDLTGVTRFLEHRVPSRAAASGKCMGDIRAFGGFAIGPRSLQLGRGIGEQEP